MIEIHNEQPADWPGALIVVGGLVAFIAGWWIIVNLGWMAFLCVFGTMLTLAWMTAVIWLLWSISRKLGPPLTEPKKKDVALPKISVLTLSEESQPSVVAEGTTRPSIYDLRRDDKGRIIAD